MKFLLDFLCGATCRAKTAVISSFGELCANESFAQ